MDCALRAGERIYDLQRGGLRIIQADAGFRFGTDSVLLADFCRPRRGERVADMGTGDGVIPLLLAGRAPDLAIDAFEIRPEAADRARRNAALNGLSARITVHTGDVLRAAETIGRERVKLAVSNPPYLQPGEGLTSPDPDRAYARGGEGACGIAAWTEACARVLQNGGRLCMVFPAFGLARLLRAYESAGVAPKRLRLVAPRPEKAPKLMLLEGIKGGGEGLRILPTLFTHREDGGFSEEMLRIYGETADAGAVPDLT